MNGRRRGGKMGIALAGGGSLGGIYEIGALAALEEALEGVTLTDLDLYVGMSSGAFIAAGLAKLAEHAYRHTLSELRRREGELAPILARHGLELDRAVLRRQALGQSTRTQTGKLWDSVPPPGETLGALEHTLSRDKPGRSVAEKRDAEAAPPDA